jgi:hypothetical protein
MERVPAAVVLDARDLGIRGNRLVEGFVVEDAVAARALRGAAGRGAGDAGAALARLAATLHLGAAATGAGAASEQHGGDGDPEQE